MVLDDEPEVWFGALPPKLSFMGACFCAVWGLLSDLDLVVLDSHRYQGLGKALLAEVEQHALAIDACKVTLEVLQNNAPARKAYADVGFVPYELAPGAGVAEFWQKKLNTNHK